MPCSGVRGLDGLVDERATYVIQLAKSINFTFDSCIMSFLVTFSGLLLKLITLVKLLLRQRKQNTRGYRPVFEDLDSVKVAIHVDGLIDSGECPSPQWLGQ